MKIRILFIAIIFAALLLASCTENTAQHTEPPETEPTAAITTSPELTVPPAERPTAGELAGLWDKIDGSTATIPLTTALHTLSGDSGPPPTHYTTSNAYHNLIWGNCDLIFVTYPSENEFAEAKNLGVEMEIIPITKDALVFLVNNENPIDDVTIAQLRDIYTGKITNWKELGGIEENIVPYQRTPDSGSQTLLMKLVMDGTEPMKPPVEWIAESMGALVEVVSSYDNAKDAIGYSMFYYVNNMYGNSRFKLLSVDGVKPSRGTITRGEYPVEDGYYAVLRKDTPAGSPARKLINWLLTDDGQAVAVGAGYIPLREIGSVSPDSVIDPLYLGDVDNSSGTGGTVSKTDTSELVVNGVRKPLSDVFYNDFNYIRLINSEIINYMSAPQSAVRYSENLNAPRLDENVKRPFAGIPNDYPNYEIIDYYDNTRVIRIIIPENNPFFSGLMSFDVRLTSDISPYGIGLADFSAKYDYGRRLLTNVDLYTLSVRLPDSSEISDRINRQLKEWTDTFPVSGGKTELLEMFVKWYTESWGGSVPEDYAYRLQPSYGHYGDYLSVSYMLQTYDGPSSYMPALYSVCFDMTTGETVNLAEKLPNNIPYLNGMVFEPITAFEAGKYPSQAYFENYVPADGSIITSAWISGDMLGLYITEPDGRTLQVNIYEWKKQDG